MKPTKWTELFRPAKAGDGHKLYRNEAQDALAEAEAVAMLDALNAERIARATAIVGEYKVAP